MTVVDLLVFAVLVLTAHQRFDGGWCYEYEKIMPMDPRWREVNFLLQEQR